MSQIRKVLAALNEFLKEHGDALTVEEARSEYGCTRARIDQLMKKGDLTVFHLFRTPLISVRDLNLRIESRRPRKKLKAAF